MYRVIAVVLLVLTVEVVASLPLDEMGAVGGAVKANAATTASSSGDDRADDDRVPVTLDGEVLFQVRGLPAYPAAERALTIRKRLATVGADPSISLEVLKIVDMEDRTRIMAGDNLIVGFVDADASAEAVPRNILAERALARIKTAIAEYRAARTSRVLLINTGYALVATIVLALLLLVFSRAFSRLDALAERRLKFQIERLESRSYQLIQAQQLIKALHGLLRFLGVLAVLAVLYIYLNLVLSLYPWTRPLAARLFNIFFDPVNSLIVGFLDILPNLVFIAILALVTRYVLKLTRLYFAGVEHGTITLAKFDQDWAVPTYKIARLIIIAFAVIIAYPHIPGSDSEAFKGVSIFIGLMFSLGSSSVIANLIAGYAMIYRRAFKIGDRVMIKDLIGDVSDIRLMVTHLRTIKNEEIVVPNSEILNSSVMNYSTLASSRGLILHTTVGIGYETPWRQVEAMLRLAAERTPGLLKQPAPFILQKTLGDFAVTYELNAYCDDAHKMARLYTAMHQNILDIFNEHGVQIMTPAYEGDPEAPKVVAKDQWFLAPAKPTDAPPDNGVADLGKSIPKVTA